MGPAWNKHPSMSITPMPYKRVHMLQTSAASYFSFPNSRRLISNTPRPAHFIELFYLPHTTRGKSHIALVHGRIPSIPASCMACIFLRRTFRTSEETSLIRTHLSIIHHSSLVSMKPQGERHRSWNSTSRRQPHQRHLDLHKTRRFNSVYPLMSLAHDHDRIQIRQMSTR